MLPPAQRLIIAVLVALTAGSAFAQGDGRSESTDKSRVRRAEPVIPPPADREKAASGDSTPAEPASGDKTAPVKPPDGPTTNPADGSKPPAAGTGRDPFAPTRLLRPNPPGTATEPGAAEFLPATTLEPVPVLVLRGFAQVGNKPPVALLDVQGEGVFLVREGDTISLQHGRTSTVLKVKKLTRGTATVEIGTLGRVVVVR
jgi:hypothetical protein